MKILLVMYHEEVWDFLSRRLRRRGYEVVVATDGQDGVDKARIEDPDIVVIDEHLPSMSGWTAARMMRDDPATAALPIIALSKHLVGDRDEIAAARCTEYSPTPVELPHLLARIEQYGRKS